MQGNRDILPLGLLPLGLLLVLDEFLSRSLCREEDLGAEFRLCHFSTLIHIVAETAIVSFHTLPVGFPLPTISEISLSTLFCSLILDHGVLSQFTFLDPKFLFRRFCSILLFTIVFNLCNNTAEVPSFTLRTALSAIPLVSDLCGVDVQ